MSLVSSNITGSLPSPTTTSSKNKHSQNKASQKAKERNIKQLQDQIAFLGSRNEQKSRSNQDDITTKDETISQFEFKTAAMEEEIKLLKKEKWAERKAVNDILSKHADQSEAITQSSCLKVKSAK